MVWKVKTDIRGQPKHALWESSVKTGKYLPRACTFEYITAGLFPRFQTCAIFEYVKFIQQRFMLHVKKLNIWTMEEVYKNELDIMRFRHNKINFEAAFDDHQNT